MKYLVLLFLALSGMSNAQMPVQLVIRGIEKAQGDVYVRIQDEKEEIIREGSFPAKKGTFEISWTIPKRTKIALWIFHDVNKNGALDKNALGIPTEPWGISGGKRPSMRPPLLREMWVNPQQPINLDVR